MNAGLGKRYPIPGLGDATYCPLCINEAYGRFKLSEIHVLFECDYLSQVRRDIGLTAVQGDFGVNRLRDKRLAIKNLFHKVHKESRSLKMEFDRILGCLLTAPRQDAHPFGRPVRDRDGKGFVAILSSRG